MYRCLFDFGWDLGSRHAGKVASLAIPGNVTHHHHSTRRGQMPHHHIFRHRGSEGEWRVVRKMRTNAFGRSTTGADRQGSRGSFVEAALCAIGAACVCLEEIQLELQGILATNLWTCQLSCFLILGPLIWVRQQPAHMVPLPRVGTTRLAFFRWHLGSH